MDWLPCLLLLIFPAVFTEAYSVTAVLSLVRDRQEQNEKA